jgi:hypothetical protein
LQRTASVERLRPQILYQRRDGQDDKYKAQQHANATTKTHASTSSPSVWLLGSKHLQILKLLEICWLQHSDHIRAVLSWLLQGLMHTKIYISRLGAQL